MKFTFIGNFTLDQSNDKNVHKGLTKTSGNEYISLNPSVLARKNNRGRCELFGMKSSVIKTKDVNNQNMEVAWEDRNDSDVVAKVHGQRKNVIKLDGKRHVFISSYDACEFILDNLQYLEGKRVAVTGRTQKDFYNGKSRDRFVISDIIEISEGDDRENGLTGIETIYWDKTGIDSTDFKSDKKIYVNGYTSEYIKEEGGPRYVAGQVVLDCSEYDFTNEIDTKIFKRLLKNIGLSCKDGKFVNAIKAKEVATNEFQLNIINGAEEVPFSYDQLTDDQKFWIEVGKKTLEDFRPTGNVYGNWITQYKIDLPTNMGQYSNGLVILKDTTLSDFEDQIYTPMADEKVDDFEESMNEPEPIDDGDDTEDVLDFFND